MSILIGADLVPTENNKEFFIDANINELFGSELCELLNRVDYRIFNLEVPLTDSLRPIQKNGPCLCAPSKCIEGYKAIKVNLLTMANNHILDQGFNGLYSTMELCKKHDISIVGAGKNIEEACKPFIFMNKGKKVGVYACTEHEYSIATEKTPGANPIDLLEVPDDISNLKEQSDYVIVLYHGGKEHYRYPSPKLQKVCRKLVEKGADLVICQHSHCIGCEEKYLQGTIVYGQGNFLFDHSDSECWKTSLLISINDDETIEYIPLVKKGHTVRLADRLEKDKIMTSFRSRNEEIKKQGFIEKKYLDYSKQMSGYYFMTVSGMGDNLLLRFINRISGDRFFDWYLNKRYTPKRRIQIENIIECEAHAELFLNVLKQ